MMRVLERMHNTVTSKFNFFLQGVGIGILLVFVYIISK